MFRKRVPANTSRLYRLTVSIIISIWQVRRILPIHQSLLRSELTNDFCLLLRSRSHPSNRRDKAWWEKTQMSYLLTIEISTKKFKTFFPFSQTRGAPAPTSLPPKHRRDLLFMSKICVVLCFFLFSPRYADRETLRRLRQRGLRLRKHLRPALS